MASVHGCRVYSRYECRPGLLSQGAFWEGGGDREKQENEQRFSSTTKHGYELEIMIIATRRCVYIATLWIRR